MSVAIQFKDLINFQEINNRDLVDRYLDSFGTHISPATLDTYRNDIEIFLKQVSQILNIPLTNKEELILSVNSDVSETWRTIILKNNIYKKKSFNKKLIALNGFYNYLCNTKHLIEYNPFENINKEKILRGDVKEKEILTKEELKQLLDTFDKVSDNDKMNFTRTRNRFLIALCNSCGYRINEALGIQLQDLKENKKLKVVEINLEGERIKNHLDRHNVICGKTLVYFRKYMKERKKMQIDSELLITTLSNKKVDYKDINEVIDRKLKSLNINKHITNHCFRHYCSSYLSTLTNEATKCSILGWKLEGMSSIYTHDTEEMLKEKIRACSELII